MVRSGSRSPNPSFTVTDAVTLPFPHMSGAVDIVCVKQKDESLRSSPFYVRFGKFQGLLKRREKEVYVTVNGVTMPWSMRLGRTGVAYFTNKAEAAYPKTTTQQTKVDGGVEVVGDGDGSEEETVQVEGGEESNVHSTNGSTNSNGLEIEGDPPLKSIKSRQDFGHLNSVDMHDYSSPEEESPLGAQIALDRSLSLESNGGGFPHFAVSPFGRNDTLDVYEVGSDVDRSETLEMRVRKYAEDSGQDVIVNIHDNQVNLEQVLIQNWKRPYGHEEDEETAGPGPGSNSSSSSNPVSTLEVSGGGGAAGESGDIAIAASAPVDNTLDSMPTSWSSSFAAEVKRMVKLSGLKVFKSMEISMCGKELADCILEDTDKSPVSADQSDCDTLDEAGEVEMTAAEVQQIFNKRLLSKEKVNKIISKGFSHQSIEGQDQQLICRVGNVLIKWTDVSNMVMTYLAFQDFPEECPKYVLHLQPSLPIVSFKWNMRKALERKTSQQEEKWRFFSWLSSTFRTPSKAQAEENTEATAQQQSQEAEESANANATADSGQNSRRGSLKENGKAKEGEESSTSSMFTPSALELEMLNLKDGQNTVTFSCYSSLWGTQTASAYIYLMPWNSKVVVSDVDGTITKSDVMGHVMTAIGKDWTHAGVSKLLKDIRTNGYHVMYLSARSIGQASVTRDFLFNLDQNGAKLPLGPVIISPDGILPSLFREMILKRPHEFKIACLQTIKDLFPKDWNPFFAGFGNRETDEFSYSAVGIPTSKIFTINPKGQVTLNSASTFKTSQRRTLQGINELVDEIFPQLKLKEGEDDVDHDQFSGYNFWKVPVMHEEIEI